MVKVTHDEEANYAAPGHIDIRIEDGDFAIVTDEDIYILDEAHATLFVQRALRALGKL